MHQQARSVLPRKSKPLNQPKKLPLLEGHLPDSVVPPVKLRPAVLSSREHRLGINSTTPRGLFEAAILDFLECLGSPRALTVWMLFSAGDESSHRQLLELSCDPSHYHGPDATSRFAIDWQATKLLSKCSSLKPGIDRKAVAVQSAFEAESLCKETNRRLALYRRGVREATPVDEDILSYIQAKIASVLSVAERALCTSTSDELDVGWSSGRTTSAFGREISSVHKYASELDVTTGALKWAIALMRDCPLWSASSIDADAACSLLNTAYTLRKGNVMTVVPKNAKTDRVICYEPHLNIRLQLAVGRSIRQALRRHGVNLDDQSINQRRALLGSKTGHLATLDLRAASDTVSSGLVELLLPSHWFELLNDLRCHYTTWPDGVTRKNEKFSSMGNGFTFELESLIFWAASMAVCRSNVSVFGDDLIVPAEHAGEVVRVLNGLGFLVNDQKSFTEGPFRESCGVDGFLGFHVTPVKISNLNKMTDYVLFHNQVRTWLSRHQPFRANATMISRWRVGNIPLGPGGLGSPYGDGHYHANLDEACPDRAGYGLDGWWYRTHSRVYDPNRLPTKVSRRLAFAAICAGTGPKRLKSVYDSLSTVGRWRPLRGLASNCWPDAMWI